MGTAEGAERMSALPPKAKIRLRDLRGRICANRQRILRCPGGFRRYELVGKNTRKIDPWGRPGDADRRPS